MQFHRLAPAGFAALVAASSLGAQSPGTVEIGGFAQYMQLDDSPFGQFAAKNPIGFGFRIGGFLNPVWQLEVDGSYGTSDQDDVPTGTTAFEVGTSTLAARLNYNIPLGAMNTSSLVLGLGGVRTNYKIDTDDDPNDDIGAIFGESGPFTWAYGVSGLAGFRFGFSPTLALRADAIAEFLPDPEAFNLTGRVGLSYMYSRAAADAGTMGTGMETGMSNGIQQPGALEIGGFLMFPIMASDWNLSNGIGGGGRVGFFVTPRWQIEGDGSYAALDVDDENAVGANGAPLTGDSYNYSTFATRLNYNIPFGTATSFVLGAGPVLSGYEYTYNYGASALAGLRFGITPQFAIRGDLVGNFLPEPSAFDIQIRGGVSYFLGGGAPTPEPTVVATPTPMPTDTAMTPTPVDTSAMAVDTTAMTPAPVDTTPAAAPVDSSAMRVEAARNVVLARIYFDFDRSDLTDSARAVLDAKLPVLQANPGMRIRILGHTDARGSDEYNLALGQRRAAAARRYLVSRGIAARRFETVSRGEEQPAVPNATTEDEHAQNRRDEFEIIIGGDNITPPQN